MLITHAVDSRASKAFSGVCVWFSVCLFVHMIKPKRMKLQSPNLLQV